MAGIYVHIPFCRKACHYCNFHFSTSLSGQSELVSVILLEVEQRQDYLSSETIETIYFGGGTPSVLSLTDLDKILKKLHSTFTVESDTEITLEANPDDLSIDYIKGLSDIGINRLSIGVQSFFDDELAFMNRSHNAQQAQSSIQKALGIIHNISVDLIFGGQYSSAENWTKSLEMVINLQIPHLSCYSLTIEEGTAFNNWIQKNKIQPINDQIQKDQFVETMRTLTSNGYEHYEISNYARDKKYAKHNTNYWKDQIYLGLGPSAHSYNGESRCWNVANNHKYTAGVKDAKDYYTVEKLSTQNKYNEYLLTSLRTMWGCDINQIDQYGEEYERHFNITSDKLLKEEKILIKDNSIFLTDYGKLFADQVAEAFFYLN